MEILRMVPQHCRVSCVPSCCRAAHREGGDSKRLCGIRAFCRADEPAVAPERARTLGQLLCYGPTIPEHTPSGQLFLVTPAPALSPLVFQSNRHRP